MSRLGDLLMAFGASLKKPESRRALRRKLRRILRVAFVGYLVGLTIFLLLVEFIGERNIFTAFFLYSPAQIWLLPLLPFAFLGLCLLDWRLLGAVTVAGFAFVWFHLDWEVGGGRESGGGKVLSVMTYNRGQRAGSLRPFKAAHRPDVVAMQEAAKSSAAYLRSEGYEDMKYGDDIGEFALLSRYPIKGKGLVTTASEGKDIAVAAWFVLDFDGEEVVVYNVHMPTPRDQLSAFRRGAFLRGLQPSSPKARAYQAFWDRQMRLAEGLRDHVLAEKRPKLVVGDFNAPDRGRVYSLFEGPLQDTHEEAGRGFGWTFPGTTRNPLSGFGPWLRIDHQFAGPGWRVLSSEAESGRKSQHLAVVARYEREDS